MPPAADACSAEPAREERVRIRLIVLLATVSGAADALGYLALGGAFASVMTGNMVLFGLGLSESSADLVSHTAAAVLSYMLGSYIGTLMAQEALDRDDVWPVRVTAALSVETALFLAIAVIWDLYGAEPGQVARLVLLSLVAVGLGTQSAATARFGVSGLSSTYLTGTLTAVVRELALRRTVGGVLHSTQILCGLIGGAAVSTLTVRFIPMLAPFLELTVLAVVLGVASLRLHTGSGRRSRRDQVETA